MPFLFPPVSLVRGRHILRTVFLNLTLRTSTFVSFHLNCEMEYNYLVPFRFIKRRGSGSSFSLPVLADFVGWGGG